MIAKKYRISRESISFILRKGESFTSDFFILKFTKNNSDCFRFACIVSKKIDKKAVIRNKFRRRIYEAIRLNMELLENRAPLDIIFIPKKLIKETKYQQLDSDIKKTFISPYLK